MKNYFSVYSTLTWLILLFSIITSCDSGGFNSRFRHLHWLTGSWKAEEKGYVFLETWTADGDSLLKGTSIILQNSDTVFRDYMSIVKNEKGIYYLGVFPGQNNDQPIWFELKTDSENKDEALFQNAAIKFPQKIMYTKTSDDSYITGIEGGEGASFHRKELSFRRDAPKN